MLSELTRPVPSARVVEWLESVDESLLYLSVLTLGEIRKGLTILARGRRRAALEAWLNAELVPRFASRVLPVDVSTADRWGGLAGEAQLKGTPVPVIDGLIAGTALQHNLTVVTRNVDDFALLGVAIFNPFG